MTRFKYFGYASNLAEYKVGLRCKSCKFDGIGRLVDRQIDFGEYSEEWQGGSATLREKSGCVVWGAIWTIADPEMGILDDQEGTTSGKYRPVIVKVLDSNDQPVECRAYEQVEESECRTTPSPQYLAVILDGARARGLPGDYIAELEKVKTNSNTNTTNLMKEIEEKRKRLGYQNKIF